MNVLNIRLNRRGADSGPPSTGQRRPRRSTMVGSASSVAVRFSAPGSSSSRKRRWSVCALDERVAERADMARRDPHLRVHQDPGVEPDDVVALLDHRPPPRALDVVLELDAERPVVPDGVDAAVDLARGEDEAAPLRERHDGLELGDGGRDVVRIAGGGVGHGCLRRAAVPGMVGRGGVGRLDASSRAGCPPASRRTLPPITFATSSSAEPGVDERVGQVDHARSRRTGPARAPSKSEPRATCSTPATSTA